MSGRIARFYRGEEPDHRGRFIGDIQSWDHARLESVHDYIQWLFPLPEPSPVNPSAPVLDRGTIVEFEGSSALRARLLQSLTRMIDFYGLEFLEGDAPVVRQSETFVAASSNWLTPGNHNHLRITRILRSTRLLGLPSYSVAFFGAMEKIYGTERGRNNVGERSFRYWRSAISEQPAGEAEGERSGRERR